MLCLASLAAGRWRSLFKRAIENVRPKAGIRRCQQTVLTRLEQNRELFNRRTPGHSIQFVARSSTYQAKTWKDDISFTSCRRQRVGLTVGSSNQRGVAAVCTEFLFRVSFSRRQIMLPFSGKNEKKNRFVFESQLTPSINAAPC